jgi:uncharacterized protein (DUF1778 family)
MYVITGGSMSTSATARFEIRLPEEDLKQIYEAAGLEKMSASKFALEAALERAQEVIAAQRTWRVPVSFFEELLSALDAPPVVNEALAKARARADQLIERR